MKKVYQFCRGSEAVITVLDGNVSIQCHFTGGNTYTGKGPEYVTDREFVMRAIEHDPRFGKDFKLIKTFGLPTVITDNGQAGVIRDAQGNILTPEEVVERLARINPPTVEPAGEAEGTVAEEPVKKMSKKAAKRFKKEEVSETPEEVQIPTGETEGMMTDEGYTIEESIGTMTDAANYFAEMGRTFNGKDELEALMEEFKVKFPKLGL